MIVSTYYQPCDGIPRPSALLDLWRESWESKGWTTQILNEEHVRAHPGYSAFVDRIMRYPTVNNRGYERACYLRHMAMVMAGHGILTDYDVILRSYDVPEGEDWIPSNPVILEPTRVPCAVLGDATAFGDICDMLFSFPLRHSDHMSDMTILRKTKIQTMAVCIEHLDSGRPIENDPGDGWKTAPMIHFSTYSFHKLGWKGDKADLIKRVLATL